MRQVGTFFAILKLARAVFVESQLDVNMGNGPNLIKIILKITINI